MMKSSSVIPLEMIKDSKVLFVYPHPDDETYCNAGLLQKLIHNGISVHVLCLTKGGASTLAFALKENELLTDKRDCEFRSVMNHLGIKSYSICDLTDGKLNSEKDSVYQVIENAVKLFNPTHLVTYEPDGIYGHPDHIFVSKLVTEIADIHSIKLIYSTVKESYKSLERDLNMAKDPTRVNPISPNFQLKLSLIEYFKKLHCLQMYKSQISMRDNLLHKIYQALQMKNEFYFTSM